MDHCLKQANIQRTPGSSGHGRADEDRAGDHAASRGDEDERGAAGVVGADDVDLGADVGRGHRGTAPASAPGRRRCSSSTI